MWLLLTSEIPTAEQAMLITEELRKRSGLPSHVQALLKSLPKTMHPMTQLSIGLLACQPDSKFVKSRKSILKSNYWEPVLEDVLDVIAKLPEIAAIVYRHTFKDGKVNKDQSGSLDYSASFNRMLGFDSPEFDELMRMYLVIHADHEGGNASAHATHLSGSTLSDPYLAYSAGLNALSGPLHGLANQEVLGWIQQLQAKFKSEGKPVNRDTITAFAWETLRAGKVIPGYGHAVLRRTDPRYECQRQFALRHLPSDPLFHIVSTVYEVMPAVLTEHGKTKNPYPNVDSHSGVLLWHYGLREYQFYTVLFGVSRAIGALSQLVWDRALQLPLENPKSVDMPFIVKYFADKDA